MACEGGLACLSASGCVESIGDNGTTGQIPVVQSNGSIAFANGDNVAITAIPDYTATQLRALLLEMIQKTPPYVAATAYTNFPNASRPTIPASGSSYVPLSFANAQSVALTFHETQAGMITASGITVPVDGFYDVMGYIDWNDAGPSGARVGGRVNLGAPGARRTHMSTISTVQRTRVWIEEPGLFLFAGQGVRIEAWTENTSVQVVDAKIGVRLIQKT